MLIATINRETSIILPAVYILDKISKIQSEQLKISKSHIYMFLILVSLWLLVKITLTYLFSASPGAGSFQYYYGTSLTQTHWQDNLDFILSIKGLYLLSYAGGSWLIFLFRKKIQSKLLKISYLLFIPFLIIMFFVGIIYELRIFGEFSMLFYLGFFTLTNKKPLEIVENN